MIYKTIILIFIIAIGYIFFNTYKSFESIQNNQYKQIDQLIKDN